MEGRVTGGPPVPAPGPSTERVVQSADPLPAPLAPAGRLLTADAYQRLAEVPPEVERFATLGTPATCRAYAAALSSLFEYELNHRRLDKTAVLAELVSRFRPPGGLGPRLLDDFQRSEITGMGLDGAIDATITSGALGVKKPDPALQRACLQQIDAGRDPGLPGERRLTSHGCGQP